MFTNSKVSVFSCFSFFNPALQFLSPLPGAGVVVGLTKDLFLNLLCGYRGTPSLCLPSSQAPAKQALGQPGSRKELSDCSSLQRTRQSSL